MIDLATRLCIVAAVAFGIIAGIGLGKRQTAPFDTTIPWSAAR